MKFVKLGLADPSNGGEPLFYRRIPMGIDTNRSGGISFLKRHAILLVRNEEETGDIRNVDLHDYVVQLYYTDSEGDKILLCSDTDVMYAMQGVVGVTASVKITAKVDAPNRSTQATQTATPRTTEAATQEPAAAVAVPTSNVAEALEDVLNCVVASANAAMAQAAQTQPERATTTTADAFYYPYVNRGSPIAKAARTSSEALKMALEQAAAHSSKAAHVAAKAAHVAEKNVDKAFGKAEKHVNKAVEKAEKQLAKTERKIEEALAAISKAAHGEPRSAPTAHCREYAAPVEEAAAPTTTAGPQSEAFIHGRHTCDACLTTPIIGDRYHAINMLDYDLCAKCHDQYKGSEIKFEVATLDRDASMQERWRRKYASLHFDGHRRRCSPRARFAHRGPPAHHHVPPHPTPSSYGQGPWPSCPARSPCDGFGSHEQRAPGACFATSNSGHVFGAAELPTPDLSVYASNVDMYNEAALEQAVRRSLEDLGLTSSPAAPSAAAPRASAPMEEEVYETNDADVSSGVPPASNNVVVETVSPEETCDEEASPEETCDEEASVSEAPVAVDKSITVEPSAAIVELPELPNAPTVEPSAATVELPKLPNAPTKEVATEVPVESHGREPKVPAFQAAEIKDSHEYETLTEAGETIVSAAAAPSSPKTTSFVEQDSSSIENFLGETLDRVANAIDNLMIVDGAEDDDEEETESQGSWSVVNDDENLARAAEMIGSALFHSDNNVGSMISSVSSAPTHVTNIVNHAQYLRWSSHLERLHELGFEDDAKSIAVLEMLMAANIGVEAYDDDVTLAQAVNHLMNGN